ncbi:ABC transporter ATP-binding protein/permease [Segnochrobactrum spirostomi]|uniref:ABC transporter ATP-binding protein/permease n=1 Tax=Segnochrobactrum spirostomi TaxID=2608987 RepID=A0A6A7Y4N6_9HYPH|nr:ABC transporter ATP-binding protein/permease [Segnochrobactrum spirostomi]MQT14104.1 ABC transporter ATP-binding protein/permease [Segnochrobactrum spirostomi]
MPVASAASLADPSSIKGAPPPPPKGQRLAAVRRTASLAWRLTVPYFSTRDVTEVELGRFGRLRIREGWLALIMAAIVIAATFADVAIDVRLSYFNNSWYDAIQQHDARAFWSLLLTVFLFWAMIAIVIAIYRYALESYLRIRWRRWLTHRYVGTWLADGTPYRMMIARTATDNPDQRIADDIDQFVQTTQSLTLGLLSAVSNLASFSVVLWILSRNFTLPGTEMRMPGFLLWGALIYTVLATWITHRVGRPLIRLNFAQQRYEADFRFSLARLREYAEQIGLLKGEQAELSNLQQRFGGIVDNYYAIIARMKRLIIVTAGYSQVNAVVPYVLVAPYYFAGKILLGGMTQTADAFSRVQETMSFFIDSYTTLAAYQAVLDRMQTFEDGIARANRASGDAATIRIAPQAAAPIMPDAPPDTETAVVVRDLTLRMPEGTPILSIPALTFRGGERTLVMGPSGAGKSTLFRAVAGVWPFGEGVIEVPGGASVLLLPQRPYLPMGPLRRAIAYPAAPDAFGDGAIAEALSAVGLADLVDQIDVEASWTMILSLGEQQRLALARVILAKPDWLFLDEATSALDEPAENALYTLVTARLPGTTVVSIGHRSTLAAFHDRIVTAFEGADGTFVLTDGEPGARPRAAE